jgi:hypothetical protein
MHTCWMSYEALLFHCSTCRVESLYKFENVNGVVLTEYTVPWHNVYNSGMSRLCKLKSPSSPYTCACDMVHAAHG